jgi:hypothetical protein
MNLKFILLFLISSLIFSGRLHTDILQDSSIKPVNSISETEWKKTTKDLNYPETKPLEPTKKPTPAKAAQPWVKYFVYGIIAALLIFLLIRLMRVSGNKKVTGNEIKISDMHDDDIFVPDAPLEKFLKEALTASDFRSAVRFSFLIAIRELAFKKLIVPSKEKTNYEYLRELFKNPIESIFREITHTFERTWYGEMPLTHQEYIMFEERFRNFNEQLNHNN